MSNRSLAGHLAALGALLSLANACQPAPAGPATSTAEAASPGPVTPTAPDATAVGGAGAPPTTTPVPGLPGNARDAVLAAMRAQLAQPAYRVRQSSAYGGATGTRLIEFVAPDRLRLVDEAGASPAVVVIGSRGWRQVDGRWQADDGSASAMAGALATMGNPAVVSGLAEKISEVRDLGGETLNGEAVRLFQYSTVTGPAEAPITSTTKLWVRSADGLPVKQEVYGNLAGGAATTVQFFEYDPGLSIEAPLP
jgi:hypothetical protein